MLHIEDLALFPLSDVVLLPQVSVPLYIFEPRYRQMTHDALTGQGQIGMVTVRPNAVDAMGGDPPIFEIGCVGRIAHSQERPDGTFQILLLGEHRFRIVEEHPRSAERLYRTARVELLDDLEPTSDEESSRLEHRRADVLKQLTQLVAQARSAESSDSPIASFAELAPAKLINALTQSGFCQPKAQQISHDFEPCKNR